MNKNLLNLTGVIFIHRKALATPVTGASKALKLLDNDPSVVLLPLPYHFKKLLTPNIMLGLTLGPELLLNLCLRGNPRMVCTRQPEHFLPLLSGPATKDILQGVIQDMPHVQNSSDVRRRDDYRISGLVRGCVRAKTIRLQPLPVPFLLYLARFICLAELCHCRRRETHEHPDFKTFRLSKVCPTGQIVLNPVGIVGLILPLCKPNTLRIT